jgi:SAM-dependent methyltransferase
MRGTERVGRHYTGDAGDAYLEYQADAGELGARLDRWKFEPHVKGGDTVVDFGCGSGGLLAALPAARRIGIEVNEPAAAAARRRGIEVVCSTSELNDGIADVVISNHALEHTIVPFYELCDLHRILKPGGRFVLWLPLDDWRAQRTAAQDPDHHLYTWTPLLLRNLLAEASFDVRDCRVVAHAWPPMTALVSRLPGRAFDLAAFAWSIARKRRQLMAVARRL